MFETQLIIIGFILIALGLVHFIFPKYFSWKKDLAQLSLVNRQMMKVHTFFIALVVVLIGLLCITSYDELISTALGQKIALGLSIFWGIRYIIQFVGYSSKLWKGKTFETIIHVVFSFLWGYLSIVFFLIYIG